MNDNPKDFTWKPATICLAACALLVFLGGLVSGWDPDNHLASWARVLATILGLLGVGFYIRSKPE